MGSTHSIPVEEAILSQTTLINAIHESDIIHAVSSRPIVSYGVMITAFDNQVLKFEKHIDIVGSFSCLTEGVNIDVLIDGELHYEKLEDLTIVLLGSQLNTITLRTYHKRPIILTFTGYTVCEELFTELATRKIKTKTSRYNRGVAKKLK